MSGFKAPIEHALVRNTVRLLAGTSADKLTSAGTGFFYQVTHPTTNHAKVLILNQQARGTWRVDGSVRPVFGAFSRRP
jgi:hypothetical protein